MTSPLRLDEKLVRLAEAEGKALKRSAPKQIEFWAEIGRTLAHLATQDELLALTQGLASVRIEPLSCARVDPNEVFAEVDEQSKSGALSHAVTRASTVYEASLSRPGMIDRIHPDGRRETGRFRNGRFTPT